METINSISKRDIIINSENGLHLRTASDIVKICKAHNSEVSIACENCPEKANGCSVLEMLLLGASKGKRLTVTASGCDAKEVLERITNYFEEGDGI